MWPDSRHRLGLEGLREKPPVVRGLTALDDGELSDEDAERLERDVASGAASKTPFLAISSLSYGYYRLAQRAAASADEDPVIAARLQRWNDLLSQAFGFGLLEDAELVHYQEYVHEDGWSVAYDHEFRVGLDAAEEYLGFELSGSGDVYIHVTRRVTDANGEDVAIDEWIPFDELFEMDVGEEIELIPAEGG